MSLSSGIAGDSRFIHKYNLGIKRLKENFGLKAVPGEHALMGSEYIYNHPQKRAEDLTASFKDKNIKGIISAIGGEDSIRMLPHIDYEAIRNNPKIFMGFSDTTVTHLIMNKAGVVSFYGPCLLQDFAEYGAMFEYTAAAIRNIFFEPRENFEIEKCGFWCRENLEWKEENAGKQRRLIADEKGYELLQGRGKVRGQFLGGCIDVFPMCFGTKIWPAAEQWKGKILLCETSEDKPSPDEVGYILRGMGAQGIFDYINGIVVGKPKEEIYYDEYKQIYKRILREFGKSDMPVLYNLNVGHALPIGIFPFGSDVLIDFDEKRIFLTESPVK